MDIEGVLSTFESQLKELGLSDDTGALLVQISIDGKSYIKSLGNLNNLSMPGIVIHNKSGIDFIEFMQQEIELANVGRSTKDLHKDTLRQLKCFKSFIDIRTMNSDFLLLFENHMSYDRQLATNTIARHMKVIKRYINVARKKEIILKDPFLNYTIRSEETHREALSEKELEQLEQYRLQNEADEVLNAFLFSCYTGLRYSDIRNITKQDIYSINRKKWLIVKMHKTNIEVRIPVSTIFDGKALLLSKSIPRSRGKLFLLESNQKTNRIVKSILKRVGIKRNISFHVGRHTFATLLIYRGVNITTVQKLLGHKSVKTTQVYSAVTDLTVEKELKKSNTKRKRKQPVSNKRATS
ncbi:tyrosine-type recombinase/integrase [Bacteroides ovatus]|uniref:tyrosine-type recombinase/integrase n=1 Tax=Bacteroides ovatus TaxID=28116 RepID=UPI00203071C3|nr:site-specific integrase [Bacteroides ovatus]MCM1722601.1 site-specific integrase [Bacteroides ovatus]MCM1758783.1 site-specific integrase [Bacteroides ovatus]MCM1869070.1 site-specific integrase [Bacteroides ovatus]MCM1912211.1 site-specific integrase [Bacteroides ovatus]